MSDHTALTKLLLEKGIITDEEYFKAIADQMEEEVHSYEKRINDELFAVTGNRINTKLL